MPAIERPRPRILRPEPTPSRGLYFSTPVSADFISSGSKLLNLALGGGWAESRVANIVGDKSTGKTLLCIEAAANFNQVYPSAKIDYREAESAFQDEYAGALGMPLDQVDFGNEQISTVEQLFDDLNAEIKAARHDPLLYFLDSLDALSDADEMNREFGKGSFGAQKAKDMSKLFRMLIRDLAGKRITVIIVSQIRDKIGVTFGRKTTRSGGKALDFYASQVLYLAQKGMITREIGGLKRVIGVDIVARCDKNKIALPYRTAEFSIMFGFGIDDVRSCVKWLKETKGLALAGIPHNETARWIAALERKQGADYKETVKRLQDAVERHWFDIERKFLPTRRKYE